MNNNNLYSDIKDSLNQALILESLEKLIKTKEEVIDLRGLLHGDISPAKLVKLMESMGWIKKDMTSNGWQQDTLIKMSNPNYSFDIFISYSGYYGGLETFRTDIDD